MCQTYAFDEVARLPLPGDNVAIATLTARRSTMHWALIRLSVIDVVGVAAQCVAVLDADVAGVGTISAISRRLLLEGMRRGLQGELLKC